MPPEGLNRLSSSSRCGGRPPARADQAEGKAGRDLLLATLTKHGFTVEPNEWWHFNYKDWKEYPILDIAFSEIK